MTGPSAGSGAATTSRPVSLTVTVVAALVLGSLLILLVPWSWSPGGRIDPVAADRVFSAAEIARAEAFSGPQRWLGWGSLAATLLILSLIGLTARGRGLVGRVPGPWWLAVPIVVLLVHVVVEMATFGFAWIGHQRRLEAGLSEQSTVDWLQDQALGLALGWVVTSIALLVLVGVARRAPRTWPAWLAAIGAGLTIGASFVYPVVVEPLFNDFTSMPAGELRSEILDVAEREGVELSDVLVADASRRTTTLNAYVSGLGDTRRVVVYDNLLTSAPRDEVLLVIAHELGHTRDHDVAVGTTLAAGGVALSMGALGLMFSAGWFRRRTHGLRPGDLQAVPLVLALSAIATLLASPVESTVSRAMEARADRTSLEITRDPDAFVGLHRRLAQRSLADPTPPELSQFWFGTHPTVLQRVAIAMRVAERQEWPAPQLDPQ